MRVLIIWIVALLAFSSCKRAVENKVASLAQRIEILQLKIDTTTCFQTIGLLEDEIKLIVDSTYIIKEDKEYRKGDLDNVNNILKSVQSKFEQKKQEINQKREQEKKDFALRNISGYYEGGGTIFQYIKDWGPVANGSFMANLNIYKNNNSRIEVKTYTRGGIDTDISYFEVVDLEVVTDSIIKGKFKNKESGISFGYFTWYSPDTLKADLGNGRGAFVRKNTSNSN